MLQGIELFCCRIRPVDNDINWTDKASVFVSELIEGQELEGNIVLSLGCSLWLDPMVKRSHLQAINVTINETCIHTQLLQNELAIENPQHLHMLYAACRGRLSLPDNPADLSAKTAYTAQGLFMDPKMATFPDDPEPVSVFVSAVAHPDFIYVQLTADKDRLLDLTDAIDVHVKLSSFTELKHIDCGLLILARFTADQQWYRAKVVAAGDDDTFDVFFVDTGEQEWLGRADIQSLPMKFHGFPFQAIECNLYHLEPSGDEWTDMVGDFLWDITRDNHDVPKTLMAQVLQKTEARSGGQFRYTIKLYDTSNEYDLEVGQFLVANGYARPSSTLVQELIPGTSSTEQLGFLKIPALCAQILKSQDADATLRLATEVQHLVAVNQRRKDAMRDAGIAQCLCHVLVYLSSPPAVSVIVTSITFFALNNDRNCEAMDKAGVINTICVLLDQMEQWDSEPLCRAVRLLANNHVCQTDLLRRGALRILAQVIKSHVTNGDKLLDIACDAVCRLITELADSDIPYVISSRCIESLCSCLTTTDNSAALSKCVTALEKLAEHLQLQDALRKFGGVKALCGRLNTTTSVPMLESVVRALTCVANGSRFNKDEMVEQKATDVLQR
ncbi:hypothetical protein LSAT2_014939 [Lamellibrachia satsuma]|nr:hypothetical protein LSAT2_014939 [Lamellibrachia satsuma]